MTEAQKVFKEKCHELKTLGFRFIPILVHEEPDGSRTKQPLTSWLRFQEPGAIPTDEEIERWADAYADMAGLAIVTGRYLDKEGEVFYLCGVDFDQKDGQPDISDFIEDLEGTMYTVTASGGFHFYFRSDVPFSNGTNIFNADKAKGDTIIDFRGEGGLAVIGPTKLFKSDRITPTGKAYRTENIVFPKDIPQLPERFKNIKKTQEGDQQHWSDLLSVPQVKKGDRHKVAASLIGKLVYSLKDPSELETAKDLFYTIYKQKFEGDLKEKKYDLERLWEYSLRKERERNTKASKNLNYLTDKKTTSDFESKLKVNTILFIGDMTVYKGDEKQFELPNLQYFDQSKFRVMHARTFNVLLPKIPARKFEEIIDSIPKEEVNIETSLQTLVLEALESWDQELDIEDSTQEAKKQACMTKLAKAPDGTIYFKFSSVTRYLRQEGLTSVNRASLANALRQNLANPIKTNRGNLWTWKN